jgi:hypothetical protein
MRAIIFALVLISVLGCETMKEYIKVVNEDSTRAMDLSELNKNLRCFEEKII